MRVGMRMTPMLEMGTLSANATLQDPDVRLARTRDEVPVVRIEEGGVIVVLEFPDCGAVARFVRRVSRLSVPRQPGDLQHESRDQG